jgi:hypothetical protein
VIQHQKQLKQQRMKKVILALGMVVAMVATYTASAQEQPAISIIPSKDNVIKLTYAYASEKPVAVSFVDKTGVISTDRITSQSFENGFKKHYKIDRQKNDQLWLQINSRELSATYKLTSTVDGRWDATLESVTYNYTYPLVATR